MLIYTAAMYRQMEQMRDQVWPLLRADGHEMTARWVTGAEETKMEARGGAEMDLEDVERSECLMLFTLPRGSYYSGGGRQVEFGYALCLRRHGLFGRHPEIMERVVVVGDREHIFCHADGVEVYETLELARAALRP